MIDLYTIIANMLKQYSLLVVLLIILAIRQAETRKYVDSISLFTFRREGSFTFIDRIHLDPGHMFVSCNIRLNLNNLKPGASYNLQVVAVP